MNNSKIINPGELRHSITVINELGDIKNSRGYVIEKQLEKFNTRAKVESMKYSRDVELENTGNEYVVHLTLRYNPKIIQSSLIEFQGKTFYIDEYINVEYLNKVLNLKLKKYSGKEVFNEKNRSIK